MFRTATLCIFVLTFSAGLFSVLSWANLSSSEWIFHFNGKDYSFKRQGQVRGHVLVDLKEVVKKLPLKLESNENKTDFALKSKDEKVSAKFSTRHSMVMSFWGKIEVSSAAEVKENKILIPIDFADKVLLPLLTFKAPEEENYSQYKGKKIDVVIDPGHGGNDFGTSEGDKTLEKDLVLKFSQELNEYLLAKGISSALTRSKDSFLTLPERTQFSNEVDAKLFLSFHFNYDPYKSVRGFEIFVMSLNAKDEDFRQTIQLENQVIPTEELSAVTKSISYLQSESNLEQSLSWAKTMRDVMKTSLPEVRNGIKMAPFYVLWGAKMPSLLIELGYINNEKDLSFYKNDEKRSQLVKAMADAVALKLFVNDKKTNK